MEKIKVEKTKRKEVKDVKTFTVKATPKTNTGKKTTMDLTLTSQGLTKKELQEISEQALKTLLREETTNTPRKTSIKKEVKKND